MMIESESAILMLWRMERSDPNNKGRNSFLLHPGEKAYNKKQSQIQVKRKENSMAKPMKLEVFSDYI